MDAIGWRVAQPSPSYGNVDDSLTCRHVRVKRAELTLRELASSVVQECHDRVTPTSRRRRSLHSSSAKVDHADVEQQPLVFSPAAEYREALTALLDRLAGYLEDPSSIAREWLLHQGGKLLQPDGNRLATLRARASLFQQKSQWKHTHYKTEIHQKSVYAIAEIENPKQVPKI